MPLDFMLSLMRDEELPIEFRGDMAKAAAPYCHPKLAPREAGGDAPPVVEEGIGMLLPDFERV
jgi:hypothetical protein